METPYFKQQIEINERHEKNIITYKEYDIRYNNNEYKLRTEMVENHIIFRLSKINEVLNYNYENIYEYLTIIKILKLSQYKYHNLNTIFQLLSKINDINKFQIEMKDENNFILNIMYKNLEGEEENHEFHLYKKYMDINDKFNILFNQISLLQDNNNKKSDEIEKLKSKINEMNNIIIKNDEEIKKLVKDKDNLLNDLNLKFVELQKEMNDLKCARSESNIMIDFNIINDKINIFDKEIKTMKENILDNKNKYVLLNELVNNCHQVKYINKMNYEFNEDPKNLKYKQNIVDTNTCLGWNDLFEIFISFNDQKEYLASPNKTNFNIDIISLNSNKLIKSLEGHKNDIRTVRYFINDDNEFLISGDDDKKLIIWDITNNYNIKHIIKTNYGGNGTSILSNLLVFNKINKQNYIITSSDNKNVENDKAATKIYSLETAKFIKYLGNTNNISIYFLLSWFNIKNNKYYVIQFSFNKIIVNDPLEDEFYYTQFTTETKENYLSGFIYKNNNKDYLCSSSDIGNVNFWDLFERKFVRTIKINNELAHIIQWNDKYCIVADYSNKSFEIIDFDKKEMTKNIGGEHKCKVICIKKVNHPIYGESILSTGEDGIIKLWSI